MAYTLSNLKDDIRNYTEVSSTVLTDAILDTTIKSGTPQEKKEMRSYLRDKYNDKDQRKYLSKNFLI